MPGGIVGDDLMRNFLLSQLPCCQCRTLGTRTCLVTKHMEFFSCGLGGVHWRSRRSHVDKCQPAGVAMGEDLHAVFNQFCAVLSNVLAVMNVLIGEFFGSGKRE